MGLVELITALGKVMAESSQSNPSSWAAIDMATGKPMAGDTRMLPPAGNPGFGGFVTDVVRASQDRMTSNEAAKIGLPDAQGLSRDQLHDMLRLQQQPGLLAEQGADVEAKKALATERTAKAGARGRLGAIEKDPDFVMANENLNQLIAKNPLISLQVADPETRLSMLSDQLSIVKAAKRGKTTLPAKAGAEAPAKGKPAAGGEKIKVRRKADGKTGTIMPGDFDAAKYEKI